MKSGVYQILNIVNNKFYIGSAINLDMRKNTHIWRLRNNKHHNNHLQASYNKYGEASFIFQILEYCEQGQLQFKEQCWIDWTKACKVGYNQRITATSNIGIKRTKESIDKFKVKVTGHKTAIETRKKIGFANKLHLMIKREAFLMFWLDHELRKTLYV
ncbi:MAG: GIY-YIG nuclease family protein [Patescibacteria group bacterium]|nr:GIY-YIG nuclease family protein [Patescibacteria group bacterium]